ncbi:hypothetical protein J437_LFUL000498 [Ladona fulva]|uniref:Icarapin-like n=1 Tax=Ladona fulva TaxID=123851 RepID=A0A8K0JTM5_LADFU|nr:hypothetical protein J437_LFUL000498 [Ladona fulva]
MAKQVFSVFLLASIAVLAASFPREGSYWRESFNRPTRADEVVVVPLEDREKESVEDSAEDDYGVGYPSPWSNSFGSFFQGMQAMLKQLRNQMQEVLSRMPQEPHGAANGTALFFPSWDSLPGNTTSTTKVINGHVVTVNETTYKQGSDGSSAVFHIRVVDIKPNEPGTNIEGNSEEVGSPSEVETHDETTESVEKNIVADAN